MQIFLWQCLCMLPILPSFWYGRAQNKAYRAYLEALTTMGHGSLLERRHHSYRRATARLWTSIVAGYVVAIMLLLVLHLNTAI